MLFLIRFPLTLWSKPLMFVFIYHYHFSALCYIEGVFPSLCEYFCVSLSNFLSCFTSSICICLIQLISLEKFKFLIIVTSQKHYVVGFFSKISIFQQKCFVALVSSFFVKILNITFRGIFSSLTIKFLGYSSFTCFVRALLILY